MGRLVPDGAAHVRRGALHVALAGEPHWPQILQGTRMGGYLLTYLLTYVLTEQADRGSVGGCCMDMWCPRGIGRESLDKEVLRIVC